MTKPNVGFICVHNSCRSQMAEAIAKIYASDSFNAYSAGTEQRDQINQDAVRIIKQLHNYDMERTQSSKLLDKLPKLDIVITMGCNVSCPNLKSKYEEDWGLDDPSGLADEDFINTATTIYQKVNELAERISNKEINL